MGPEADRNLLLGVLALQMGFVSRDAVIAAMQAWAFDRSRSLGEILVSQGALADTQLALMEPLVTEHLRHHHGDALRTLAASGALASIRQELTAIHDAELCASLSRVGDASHTPDAAHNGTAEVTIAFSPTTSGRFEILRPHAQGGLGEVFIACDKELNREIALKQIHSRLAGDAASRMRFVQEAEISGRLEHPGVPPVYALGHHADGRPYYAMKLIRGETLKYAIERFHHTTYADSDSPAAGVSPASQPPAPRSVADLSSHSLEFRQLLGRFVDVCNTVGYAHSRGVLHRDLKPSNIMLGNFGETLVVDWGLAKALGKKELPVGQQPAGSGDWLTPSPSSGSAETVAGAAIGTPAFMSPEQAAGRLEELGPATDVYGLGATLYCLLTGHPPLSGGYVGDTLQKVQRGEFPRPRSVQPAVPAALEAICLRAMALDRHARYPSAQALAADIEHWLADEPVSAWREPVPARLARWSRRHKAVVGSAAALLLAATISAAVGAVLVGREQTRTEQAEAEARSAASLADSQARAATAVSHFLIGMFEEPTPYEFFGLRLGNRDLDPAARALLDRGTQQLTAGLDDQPLLKAAMLAAIGHAHNGTGDYAKARPVLEEALAILQRELPPDDLRVADVQERLATVYFHQDRTAESEKLARTCLGIRRLTRDETDPLVVDAKVHLGLLLTLQRKSPDEAEKLWREVLDARRKTLAPDDPGIAEAMAGLAGALLNQEKRQWEVALLVAGAFNIFNKHDQTRELGLVVTSAQRAVTFVNAGNNPQALEAAQDALNRMERLLGPRHPFTLFVIEGIAAYLHREGHDELARPMFDQLMETYPENGITFRQPQFVQYSLAQFEKNLKSSAGGEEQFKQLLLRTLARQKEFTMYRSRNTSTLLARIAKLLRARGEMAEAQPLVNDYLATTGLPEDIASICDAEHLVEVANILVAGNKTAEAARLQQRFLPLVTQPQQWQELEQNLRGAAKAHFRNERFAELDAILLPTSALTPNHADDQAARDKLIYSSSLLRARALDKLGQTAESERLFKSTRALGSKLKNAKGRHCSECHPGLEPATGDEE